jgi:hypothetical protein
MLGRTKKPLAHAIAVSISVVSIFAGAASDASAQTMYNTHFPTAGTDGHTGAPQGTQVVPVPWVGTAGGALPFDFSGGQALNWAVLIEGSDPLQNSETISAADALASYGATVKIDTNGGSWFDGTKGWGHTTDFGLFKSDSDMTLTISAKSLDPNHTAQLGFTIFSGMDTGLGFDRHMPWNAPIYPFGSYPRTSSNPFFTEGVNYLGHAAPDEGNYNGLTGETIYTMQVAAGQIYSMYLGGFKSTYRGGYQVTFTPSAVPLPAAGWLLGWGLLGLLGFSAPRKMKCVGQATTFQ